MKTFLILKVCFSDAFVLYKLQKKIRYGFCLKFMTGQVRYKSCSYFVDVQW